MSNKKKDFVLISKKRMEKRVNSNDAEIFKKLFIATCENQAWVNYNIMSNFLDQSKEYFQQIKLLKPNDKIKKAILKRKIGILGKNISSAINKAVYGFCAQKALLNTNLEIIDLAPEALTNIRVNNGEILELVHDVNDDLKRQNADNYLNAAFGMLLACENAKQTLPSDSGFVQGNEKSFQNLGPIAAKLHEHAQKTAEAAIKDEEMFDLDDPYSI